MKKTLLTLALLVAGAISANAQYAANVDENTGTGVLTFSVGPSVDIRNAAGYTQNIAHTNSVGNSGAFQPLSFTINFGDVSTNMATSGLGSVAAGQAHPLMAANAGIQLRSNTPYSVYVSRSGALAVEDSDNFTFDAGDVGMSISPSICSSNGDCTNVRPGAQSSADAGRAPNYLVADPDGDFGGSYQVANGIGNFGTHKLNNVSVNQAGNTGTLLVTGSAISNGGDNSTNNNALDFKLRFGVKPEYYGTMAAKSETLTFTILPNP